LIFNRKIALFYSTSIIHYPLSIIHYPLSIVNYPLSIIYGVPKPFASLRIQLSPMDFIVVAVFRGSLFAPSFGPSPAPHCWIVRRCLTVGSFGGASLLDRSAMPHCWSVRRSLTFRFLF